MYEGKNFAKVAQYADEIKKGKYTLDSLSGQIPNSWIEEIKEKLNKENQAEDTEEDFNDSMHPIYTIPSKYKGLNSFELEEIWAEKIYSDSDETEFRKQERRNSIDALRNQEIKAGEGIFMEDEDEIMAMIPKEFQGLSSDLINEVWEFDGGNAVQKKYFEKKKQLIIDFIRNKENKLSREYQKATKHHQDQEKISSISKELGKDILNESREKNPSEFNSYELNNSEIHAYGNLEKDGLEVMFLNNDHGQDAFAIYEDTYVVSDGASSYGKAGSMSSALSRSVAENVSNKSIEEVFSKESMSEIITSIKDKKEYKNDQPVVSHAVREGNQEAGLATLLVVKLNKEEKTISYGSIGDSPLFVIDRNSEGEIISFEILNEDKKITNENYFLPECTEDMKNPETHLIGLRGNGEMTLSSLNAKKTGTIEYKENRVVLLGSDALIKSLISSPEIWQNKVESGSPAASLFKDAQERYEKNHPDLWIQNPSTGKKMFNPLFFTKLSKDELSLLLSGWKNDAYPCADDMTMIAIDLDKHFKV